MNSLIQSMLEQAMKQGLSDKVGSSVGIESDKANSIISMLAPALLGGLQKNASDPLEAENITKALQKDHASGSIFDHLESLIQNPQSAKGEGILSHIFGDNKAVVEEKIAKENGVSSDIVSKIAPMIAPLVMGYIGKKMFSSSSTASSNDLLSMLMGGGKTPSEQSFLSSLIDQNNDGSMMDDIMKMGMNFLKNKA